MTNSDLASATTDSAPTGKRARLVAAARQMVHQQGVESTTLADIAQAAGVPLGNVYYYFKTKDDIIQAVVESHLREADTLLAGIEDGPQRVPDLGAEPGVSRVGVAAVVPREDHRHRRDGERKGAGD